jgi:hypothetical protein
MVTRRQAIHLCQDISVYLDGDLPHLGHPRDATPEMSPRPSDRSPSSVGVLSSNPSIRPSSRPLTSWSRCSRRSLVVMPAGRRRPAL